MSTDPLTTPAPASGPDPWALAATIFEAQRVLLARPTAPEWYLAGGDSQPRDQLYRALLSRPEPLPEGAFDTSLLGDVGLRLRAAGVTRLLCLPGPEPDSVFLVENPHAGADPGRAAQLAEVVGRTRAQPAWGPVAAALSGPLVETDLEAVARWLHATSRQPRQSLVSSASAGALAEALDAEVVVILRPHSAGVVAALGTPVEHHQAILDLPWPLPADSSRLFAALDGISSQAPAGPWQVVTAQVGDLALAINPPGGNGGAVALLANFLGADAERSRTTREGRQRTLLEERMRIASLIHDGVTQQVSNVVIQLQLLELMASDPVRMMDMVRSAREATQGALEELRASLYELAPRQPDWEDLTTGLRSFAADYSAQWGIDITVEGDSRARSLDAEVMMLAYSAVQECLTNVRKHSEADSVVLGVDFEGSELVITVADDGVGFPAGPAEGAGSGAGGQSAGLRLLRDRVVQAGGSLRIQSEPGQGATVRVRLPL